MDSMKVFMLTKQVQMTACKSMVDYLESKLSVVYKKECLVHTLSVNFYFCMLQKHILRVFSILVDFPLHCTPAE